jgi:Cd2+/Zn2+-exporting ATPase
MLKVQHDPKQVSCENIVQQLHNESGLSAEIFIDGAVDMLYLPKEIVSSLEHASLQKMEDKHSRRLRIHVILSGIFWVVSMVSILLGRKWLEYFGLLSVAFGLPPVARKAWKTARRREFDANCMMVTAAIGALILGEIDEAASVSFLFSVSEYLETKATERARKALEAIIKLRPEYANLIHPVTKEIIIVPSEKVRVGSLVSVRTGDKIAADGVVVEGTSSVDESSLTGESAPVHKAIDSAVSGGTINVGMTQLVVKTTTSVENSAVSRLIRLVEEATINMSPTEKMIDSFARAYTPAVVSMAAIMATVPWIFGVETGRYWTLNALIIIVISCPCALTISTPVTYAAGLAAAAQKGIVVKGGASLEALGSVDKCLFDKTGTLTRGKFSVLHLDLIGEKRSRKEMLSLLALMEAPSSHPLSATLVKAAKKEGVLIPTDVQVKEHRILKGEGVEATVNGKQVYVGNKRLFERLGMYEQMPLKNKSLAETWMKQGGTIGFLGVEDEGILAAFCMSDEVRSGAKETVEALMREGVDVMLLTGDSDGAANAVAKKVGIRAGGIHSQLLPEDKLHLVGSFKRPPQRNNFGLMRRNPKVLFVGDGVNDAPAIAVVSL